MKNHSIITRVAVVVGITLGAFALSALADWSAPFAAPPTCVSGHPGCDAPIHVGSASQIKAGGLGLGALGSVPSGTLLDVLGTGVINDLWIDTLHITGSAQTLSPGSVLTDVNGDGNATWQPASSGGGGGGGVDQIVAGTNISITPVTGKGTVTINASSVSGTVGGGCSALSSVKNGVPAWTGSSWGNGGFDSSSNICTCPGTYTSQPILKGDPLAVPSEEAFLCIKN